MNKEFQNYHWLDLLRFSAAFLVILCHTRGTFFVEFGLLPISQQTPIYASIYAFTRLGAEAVYCFFVISGFLVGGKALIRIKEKTFNLKDYTLDRTVRIMLPLFPALILIYTVNLIIRQPNDLVMLIGNLFSLQGILVQSASGPLWSLSVEVWFYISMGAIATFFVYKDKLTRILCFSVLIICAIVFTKLSPIYAMIWFLSAFAYLLYPIPKNRILLLLSFIALGIIIFLLQITVASKSISFAPIVSILPSKEILQILFSFTMILIVLSIINFNPQNKILQKIEKSGTHLAAFSYTLYLTHMPLLILMHSCGFPKSKDINIYSVVLYFTELTICMIAAWIIYLGFEKHTYAVVTIQSQHCIEQ